MLAVRYAKILPSNKEAYLVDVYRQLFSVHCEVASDKLCFYSKSVKYATFFDRKITPEGIELSQWMKKNKIIDKPFLLFISLRAGSIGVLPIYQSRSVSRCLHDTGSSFIPVRLLPVPY